MSKKLLLSIPDQIMKKLKEQMKMYAYSTTQEVIIDVLRDKFFFYSGTYAKPKVGRPRKLREGKILTRKKIFSKKGEPISI